MHTFQTILIQIFDEKSVFEYALLKMVTFRLGYDENVFISYVSQYLHLKLEKWYCIDIFASDAYISKDSNSNFRWEIALWKCVTKNGDF